MAYTHVCDEVESVRDTVLCDASLRAVPLVFTVNPSCLLLSSLPRMIHPNPCTERHLQRHRQDTEGETKREDNAPEPNR